MGDGVAAAASSMKLDANVLRYLTKEEFRVLTAVEQGQKNVREARPVRAHRPARPGAPPRARGPARPARRRAARAAAAARARVLTRAP